MPTATPPLRLSPRALVTFSNRKPVRCSSFSPRNCQRTSGINSVSLLIGIVTRRSSFRWSSSRRCVRRSCRLVLVCVRSSILLSYPFVLLILRGACHLFPLPWGEGGERSEPGEGGTVSL